MGPMVHGEGGPWGRGPMVQGPMVLGANGPITV